MSKYILCVICRSSKFTAGRAVEKTHMLRQYILNAKIWSITICHLLYTRWLTALYRTSNSITMFTTPLHLPVCSARLISSMPSHAISLKSTSILSSHLRLGLSCSLLPSYFPSEPFLFRRTIKDPMYMVNKLIFWPLYLPEAYLHAYCMALLLVQLSSQSCYLFLQHPFTDLKLLCLSCRNSQCPLLLNSETPQLYHLSFIGLQLWQLHKKELN